jgi:hypothetical protein
MRVVNGTFPTLSESPLLFFPSIRPFSFFFHLFYFMFHLPHSVFCLPLPLFTPHQRTDRVKSIDACCASATHLASESGVLLAPVASSKCPTPHASPPKQPTRGAVKNTNTPEAVETSKVKWGAYRRRVCRATIRGVHNTMTSCTPSKYTVN